MRPVILLMDNILEFLELQANLLEIEGYQILKAETVAKGRKLLAERRIHLALMDIRMEDEDEKEDTSGLQLARDPQFQHIPKIILTAHRDKTSVQELIDTLTPVRGGVAPALTVIDKELTKVVEKTETPERLSQIIKQTLADHVPINWNLSIRWQNSHTISFEQLAFSLYKKIKYEQLEELVADLQDVFSRLFPLSTKLTIGDVLHWQEGQCILKAFAYDETGIEEQFVISVGKREQINKETERFKYFASKQPQDGNISLESTVSQGFFAATRYKLVGGDLVAISIFGDYFQRSHWQELADSLRFLFSNSLKRQGKKQELKVAGQSFCEESLLWLNLDQWSLNEKIEHLCQEVKDIDQPELPPLIVTEQSIELEMPASLSLYFPNPLKVLLEENLPKPNQVRYLQSL